MCAQELTKKKAELDKRIAQSRRARLDAAYDFFDVDGNGVMNLEEFHDVGKAMNPNTWKEEESETMFATLLSEG